MKFKSDKYKSARGRSQLLNISCRKCENHIVYYQKDGPGSLRRMYIDRVLHPNKISDNQYKKISELKPLTCKECKQILGHPIIYKKENRHAYRLFVESVKKEVVNIKEVTSIFEK
jgi:RNase P subunit RPR2